VADDRSPYGGTPWWGWALIIVALAMMVGVLVKSLSTGHG
jgi:hypothetical protein